MTIYQVWNAVLVTENFAVDIADINSNEIIYLVTEQHAITIRYVNFLSVINTHLFIYVSRNYWYYYLRSTSHSEIKGKLYSFIILVRNHQQCITPVSELGRKRETNYCESNALTIVLPSRL